MLCMTYSGRLTDSGTVHVGLSCMGAPSRGLQHLQPQDLCQAHASLGVPGVACVLQHSVGTGTLEHLGACAEVQCVCAGSMQYVVRTQRTQPLMYQHSITQCSAMRGTVRACCRGFGMLPLLRCSKVQHIYVSCVCVCVIKADMRVCDQKQILLLSVLLQ